MELGLRGKSAIVTGASAGIGRALVAELIAEGVDVLATARRGEALEALKGDLGGGPGTLEVLVADSSKEDAAATIHNAAISQFGKLDILINNVGSGRSDRDWQTPIATFEDTMNLNLYAAVRLTQKCVPELQASSDGNILNMSSASAHSGLPSMGDYNASKAALTMWSKTISKELAPEVRVNSVCPAFIRTPLWDDLAQQLVGKAGNTVEEVYEEMAATAVPMKRYGSPEEVSGLCAFIVSERAAFITGSLFNIDGGYMQYAF